MDVMEAETVFRSQMKSRWTDWKETDAEKADWIRRIMNFTSEEIRVILDRLSDTSYGKKPSAKDFFDISTRFLPPKPKPKPYEDVWVYLVCLGDCPKGSVIERWKPGVLKPIVFRCSAGTNLQDDVSATKFLDIVREYISRNYRVLPSFFDILFDENQARKRSEQLQEQGLF